MAVVHLRNVNGSTEREAKLVLVSMSLARIEKAAGIELVVIVERESSTVDPIRSALHRVAGHTRESVSVFGRVVVRNQLELADGIDGRIDLGVICQIAS